jgi:hypothetical protein
MEVCFLCCLHCIAVPRLNSCVGYAIMSILLTMSEDYSQDCWLSELPSMVDS